MRRASLRRGRNRLRHVVVMVVVMMMVVAMMMVVMVHHRSGRGRSSSRVGESRRGSETNRESRGDQHVLNHC
jgi:preprotein translocase subunit SecG